MVSLSPQNKVYVTKLQKPADPDSLQKIYDKILQARTVLQENYVMTPSPCEEMRFKSHSKLRNKDIYMKMEFSDVNKSLRRVFYAITKSKSKGVISASAGNFAIDLCYCGSKLQIPVKVVMPRLSPFHKIRLCKQYESRDIKVIIEGEDILQATAHAKKLANEQDLTYISEDDLEVMAGLGTLGLDIIEQVPDLDVLVLPNVYSGALTAGIAVAVKKERPNVKIVAVRVYGFIKNILSPADLKSFDVRSIADELICPGMKSNISDIMNSEIIDEIISLPENLIAHAIQIIVESEKFIVEGSSAATVATVLCSEFSKLFTHKKRIKVVLLLNEANFDPDIMNRCIYYGLYLENRLMEFTVTLTKQKEIIYLLQHIEKFGICLKRISYNLLTLNVVCQHRNQAHLDNIKNFINTHFEKMMKQKVSFQYPTGIL